MSLNLNPWLALLLGILIGWLLEWLLELWFFRRRRLECQGQLSQVEADLRTKEIELGDARAHADSLQADLTALASARRLDVKAEAPTLEAPVVKIETPELEASLPEAALPAVVFENGAELSAVEIATPRVELPEAGLAAVAGVGLAGLAGKFEGEVPEVETRLAGAPVEMPEIAVEALAVVVPTVAGDALKGERSVNWTVAPVAGEVQIEGGALKGERSVNWTVAPVEGEVQIEGGALKGERSVNWTVAPVEPEAPRAEVKWPEIGGVVAEVSTTLPLAAEIETPSVGAELPAAVAVAAGAAMRVGLPEAAIEVTQPQVDERSVNWTAAPAAPDASPAVTGDDLEISAGIGPVYATQVTSCPQDLSKLRGIGTVYEQKLYAAGIGTFWQLAEIAETDLAQILGAKDFQKVNPAEIKAAARQMAETTDTIGRTWDGSQPDDFEPLGGIGEVYEGRLYAAGICTYAALAAATVEQVAEICKAPAWRMPDYARWIAQAAARVAKGK